MTKSRTPAVIITIVLLTMSYALLTVSGQSTSNISDQINSSPNPKYGDLLQYEWPQFSGDSTFSHFSSGPAPEAPDILWKTNVTGIQPYISAFDGEVFVCSKTTVYAIDNETGDILWSTNVTDAGLWPAVYKIDDSHLVEGNSCLDPKTGQILWTSDSFSASSAPLFNYNVYSPEEQMFYTKANSFVYAWNFSNPNVPPMATWSTYVSGSGSDGSGLQYGAGIVFVGSFEAHQVALDAKSGTVLWDTNTRAAMLFSGAYDNGKFFRGGAHDNTFYAFDAKTGEIVWTFKPGTEGGYFCTGVATAYGMVYSLNMDGNLYALDENTGKLIWKYTGPGSLMFPGNPTVADGKIYATTGQKAAYGSVNVTASEFACLDAYTGQVIWKLPIEAFAPRESMAIAYGRLYLIPGDVTTAVDTISGAEYSTANQVWAIGTSSWPMFRGDSAHSAVGQSGPNSLILRWNFTTEGAVVSSPSIANGIAYFGSQDKNIYAIDARDGSLIWKFPTLDRIESSLAVSGGRVFSGTDDGFIYCLDAYNGSLIWKTFITSTTSGNFNAAVQLRSSPTVEDGFVYVGALNNNTYCIDANDGTINWQFQTQGYITSSPAVVNGSVYVVSQEPEIGALYKLSPNGTEIWKHLLPYMEKLGGGTDMHASPLVANGMVFASSDASAYYGIDAADGRTIWTYKDDEAAEFILCSPVYVDGRLFIIDKFSVVCLDAKNGKPLWSSFTGDELYVSPTYADEKLYVVTDQRSVFVLNATNGNKIGKFNMASNSWSAPSIYEGRVYVGSNDWNVYCLADYPSLISDISVSLSNPEVNQNELVTGWGQLTPGMPNATVNILVVRPDGIVNALRISTSEKGAFTFTFTPDAVGNWSVAAEWQSDKSFYRSAASGFIELQVKGSTTPSSTDKPIPSESPASSRSPTPTPTPLDQLTFFGVPMLYVYIAIVATLVAFIVVAGYLYMKSGKMRKD